MRVSKLFTGNDKFCKVVAPEHQLRLAGAGLCKWPQERITYFEAMTLDAPGLDVHAVYDEAWRQWADVCNIRPARVSSVVGANVAASQGPIDGPWGTLAQSYLPCGASATTQLAQLYDDGETWAYAFLLGCACHEIGHALGLNHLDIGNLMAPMLDRSITKPQPGDIAEIQARYGRPGTPTPTPIPTPVPHALPLDGEYHDYVVGPGREGRYLFRVPSVWYRPRTKFSVSTRGAAGFTPAVTLYGRRGKTLAREANELVAKLYAGDYSVGIQDLRGGGGSFSMAAKLG